MAYSINKVSLLGRVGSELQFRTTSFEKDVAFFSLATGESWKNKTTGEIEQKTEWHRIVIYNTYLVDYVRRHVSKGSMIYLEGQINYKKWNDKNGNERDSVDIVVPQFSGTLILCRGKNNSFADDGKSEEFLEGKDFSQNDANIDFNDKNDESEIDLDSEDLPF